MAIGAKRDGYYRISVAQQCGRRLAGVTHIPQQHAVIEACGGQGVPIRAKRQLEDQIGMALKHAWAGAWIGSLQGQVGDLDAFNEPSFTDDELDEMYRRDF